MNVIVANDQQKALSNLDIDVIKSISGTYDATEIVEMFKNFFYCRLNNFWSKPLSNVITP